MLKPGIKVNIFGQSYLVKGDTDEEYVRSLAAHIDGRMKEIAARSTEASPTRIAVMTALNICDEYFKMKRQQAKIEAVADDLFKSLED